MPNEKDPHIMGKIMKKIVQYRLRYYVDCDGVVRTYYNGEWWSWDEVAKRDSRLSL